MSVGLRVSVGAVALAGALAFVLLRSPSPSDVDASSQTGAEQREDIESAIPAEPRVLPAQQLTTSAREARSAPPPRPPADFASSAGAAAVSMSQLAADVQIASPEVAGHITEAESDMAAQNKDPVRSAAMETRIFSEIAQKSLGLQMTDLQVDCRITLCRVQFVLPKSFLEKKFGNVPRDAVWTGREPVGFFLRALDLNWRYTSAFGGLDRYGSPVVLGYVAMPTSQ